MTEGRPYKADYITFARILGFGAKDREFYDLHMERTLINVEITFMYERHALADGLVKGLKSFYYILNNLFKQTIAPKGGAHTNLYGLTRNVLARMRSTRDPFSVSRFIWNELQDVMDDARRGCLMLPM